MACCHSFLVIHKIIINPEVHEEHEGGKKFNPMASS
jgi:hypothetical protein